MATTICSQCGTRNADTLTQCRRCGGDLPTEAAESETLRGSPTGPAAPRPQGKTVLAGRWRVLDAIDHPYSPHLYRGVGVDDGRAVVIKRLDPQSARDRAIRARFSKEAELLAGVDHDHVVRVLEVVDEGDAPAIVMESPAGESLHALLERKGRLPIPIVIGFGLQILHGLDYLHERGIFHRNLRADNVLVGPHPDTQLPHVTITDFGLARSVLSEAADEQAGTLLGMKVADTASFVRPNPYLAPELFEEESDSRSDLYALGAILFELLTDRLPVAAGLVDPDQIVRAVKTETPTPLRMLRPEASAELEAVLARMLRKRPDDRFIDVSETRTALLAAAAESMVRVAAGPFLRGSGDDDPHGRDEEKPQRSIHVDAFFIDRFPVTVGQYRQYLQATGKETPEEWERYNGAQMDREPVVFVTWQDAADFAEWAGKRLPTEAEWEKAARGPEGRLYPWGDETPDAAHAWFGGKPDRCEAGQHPAGASYYGVLDMAGNVFEWVGDWYAKNYYAQSDAEDPEGPEDGKKRVLRGGSFVHDAFALRCATRGRYAPEERRANHSFRCVWSLR